MTGVRVRSAVDRSILGLSSWLPDVAAGFAGGGLIGSTHATQRVARRVTRPRPPSFRGRRSGACYKRGSSFRSCTARERCRWCARSRLPCRSFDHRIHARQRYALLTFAHWKGACAPASACPWASCDECERETHAATASPRFSQSNRPCPPARRWLYCRGREPPPAAPRRERRHASPCISGSAHARGQSRLSELPPKRWTPLLSSFWSRKVFYGYGTSSISG